MPGASAYFLGGAVVYTRDARRILMDIPDEAMKGIRSASEPYAKLLASQIRQRFSTDWGLSETGATGPTGNRYGDAAGHSCMAVAGPEPSVMTLETGSADRLGQHARVRGYGAESAVAEFVAVRIRNFFVVPANAGTHTPRRLDLRSSEATPSRSHANAGGYGSLRSQGRRVAANSLHFSRNARINWSLSGLIR